ncbi:hypothetical protein Gpo141_00014396, partial [Globisporangium polare]
DRGARGEWDAPLQDKGSSVAQHRFLYTSQRKFQVESNGVLFSEYKQQDTEDQREEEDIFATDFVDHDDLSPFSPESRMRKDITCILHVQSCD